MVDDFEVDPEVDPRGPPICETWLARSSEDMALRALELLTGDPRRLIAIAQAARESWARRFTLERYHHHCP